MSDSLPPLPPEIASLLAREAEGYANDPILKASVRSGVEWSIALAAGSLASAHRAGGSAAAGKIATAALTKKLAIVSIAAFLAGTGAGGAAVGWIKDSRVSHAATDAGAPTIASPILPTSSAFIAPLASPSSAPTFPRPAAATQGASPDAARTARPTSDLARERELLDVARAALARGRAEDAMAAVDRHERLWPHGALAEDRELLAIQSLVVVDPTGRQSRARAVRFRREFPNSILMPAIDAALESLPDERKAPTQ